MASSIAPSTILRSIAFSRATASAICSSSSLLALTVAIVSLLALILFALAQRFRDERVGENEPRFHHVIDPQQNVLCRVTMYARTFAFGAVEFAAESFGAVDRVLHFDLGDVADIAREVGPAPQGPIDPRRRDFQPIRTFDGIGDIEDRRQRARDGFAILDTHRPVGPFGHDLDRAAGKSGYAHADQAIAEPGKHRLGQRGDARGPARVGYEPWFLDKFCRFKVARSIVHDL